VLALAGGLGAGDWPQWRGPEGTGSSAETGLPVAWSETDGIAWKLPLPEWGTSTPVIWGEAVFLTAQKGEDLLLLRISKSTGRIEWTRTAGTASDLLFMVSDNGIATCLDAESGEVRWRERIPGDYRSSPIAAEGRVDFLSMNGLATVVAASGRFEKLAENRIDALALSVRGTESKRASGDGETIASPAISDGRIFLRGRRALYAIGRPFGGK
jgi:outer membrane protein assembly factor BamB